MVRPRTEAERQQRLNDLLETNIQGAIELARFVEELGGLTLNEVRFCAAELLVLLRESHECGMVHRHMRLRNILVDEEGHLCLVDNGLSGSLTVEQMDAGETTFQLSDSYLDGTALLAPELFSENGHSFEVDLWSLGVVMYRMLTNWRPFFCVVGDVDDPTRQVELYTPFPDDTPASVMSLIKGLVRIDAGSRTTIEEAMNHEFFEGVDWQAAEEMTLLPPWVFRTPPPISIFPHLSFPDYQTYEDPAQHSTQQSSTDDDYQADSLCMCSELFSDRAV